MDNVIIVKTLIKKRKQKMIKKYIRDEKGNPIGMMVADAVGEDKYGIGYSIVKKNSSDVFDKDLGEQIALNRARHQRSNEKILNGDVPSTVGKKNMETFIDRSIRYFKNRKLLAYGEKAKV